MIKKSIQNIDTYLYRLGLLLLFKLVDKWDKVLGSKVTNKRRQKYKIWKIKVKVIKAKYCEEIFGFITVPVLISSQPNEQYNCLVDKPS